MDDLLKLAIEAHGGLERWRQFVAAHWIGLWAKRLVAHIAVNRINISIEAKPRLT